MSATALVEHERQFLHIVSVEHLGRYRAGVCVMSEKESDNDTLNFIQSDVLFCILQRRSQHECAGETCDHAKLAPAVVIIH